MPGAEESMFAIIQHRATALVKKVLPENMGHFADLFLAAVHQTAVTGEVLLDEELGKLAKQNLPKFQRLNQRLQVTILCINSPRKHPSIGCDSDDDNQGPPAYSICLLTHLKFHDCALVTHGSTFTYTKLVALLKPS